MLNKYVCLLYTVNLFEIKLHVQSFSKAATVSGSGTRYLCLVFIVCHYLFQLFF